MMKENKESTLSKGVKIKFGSIQQILKSFCVEAYRRKNEQEKYCICLGVTVHFSRETPLLHESIV